MKAKRKKKSRPARNPFDIQITPVRAEQSEELKNLFAEVDANSPLDDDDCPICIAMRKWERENID
jgi:hypothetical protein